ncbi:MAG: SDR family oxidoreductase [Chloroflexi bacterium]|nr:SDR family oxidoreductase [Chloroflexota bacterium]MBV9544422.1 SDR family oxidoreductase [Chloroflexota bacterium]
MAKRRQVQHVTDVFAAASEAVARELSVQDKVVLVTGGGAGLGRATASLLARRGARMALLDVRPDRVKEACASLGEAALGLVADVSEPSQIQTAIDRTVDRFGRLDIMINCAGITRIDPFLEITLEQYRQSIDINLTGSFFGTQLAARQMIKQAPGRQPGELIGRIINVTSPSAEANSDHQMVYSMTKAAVNRLTGGAAAALYERHGICVSAIKPYAVPSPMLEGIFSRREELFGLPAGDPARARARQLVRGRFEPLESHAEVLAWMCAAPPEVINGRYVTSTPHTAPL